MEDFKYCGNILLGEGEKVLWQNVYSSQSYQSFYSIFAKLESSAPNGDSLTKLDLELFNYKGLLDMAFFRDKTNTENPYHKGYFIDMVPSPKEIQEFTGYEKHVELRLYVCARFSKDDAEKKLSISKEDLKEIKVGDGQMMMVKRQTISFNGLSGREIRQFDDDMVQNIYSGFERTGIYDEEFYFRNGTLYRKKEDTDGSLLTNSVKGTKEYGIDLFNGNPSCHNTLLYFRHKGK